MTHSPAVQTQPGNYKWKAFWTVVLALFVMVMDLSVTFLTLSTGTDDFGVALRSVTHVAIASALAISAIMLPFGRVTDIIGRNSFRITAAPAEVSASAGIAASGPKAAATAGAD